MKLSILILKKFDNVECKGEMEERGKGWIIFNSSKKKRKNSSLVQLSMIMWGLMENLYGLLLPLLNKDQILFWWILLMAAWLILTGVVGAFCIGSDNNLKQLQ